MSQQAASVTTNEFDAAKTIVDTLKGLDTKEKQLLALRFATESLGLHIAPQALPSVSTAPATIALQGVPVAASIVAALDIRTFVQSKKPKTDLQFTTAVAYYHRFISSPPLETINVEILLDGYRKVGGWNIPKKPAQALVNAKNAGYLDTAGRGEYRINSVGENLVAMALGGGDGEPRKKPIRAKNKKPAKKAGK